jgi:mono/diheme cytochrome c family protein
MKAPFNALCSFAATLLAAAALTAITAARSPQAVLAATSPQPVTYPAPTNLKVLPNSMTGQQVNDLMQQWQAALGARCSSCHAKDYGKTDPDGRPLLDFASDSKPMKAVARAMAKMTDEINTIYIAHIDSSADPVTCGTCHRGHLSPDPFVAPADAPPPTR